VRTSTIVATLAIATAAALVVYGWTHDDGYECAECDSDADCDDGMRCRPFDDGESRCVERELLCRQGHTQWPYGLKLAMVMCAVVAVFAFSARRLRDRISDE
jgi:hypothetical protein